MSWVICVVSNLNASFSGLITSVGERKVVFFCCRLLVIVWFWFGDVSSASLCLR